MPPSPNDVAQEIQSSDRFADRVAELAARFHDQAYKNDRIPAIKADFQARAEAAGLPSGAAQGVAGRLIGALIGQAQSAAPPPPEDKWDRLATEKGPLPEARAAKLPGPMYHLLRLVADEPAPFRQAHRLIDAIEWAVKWHTTLALSDLLSVGEVPDRVKLLLARSLQTPSLGTWNRFFREAVAAFDDIDAAPALPWDRFERLTGLEQKHHLVAFRNEYAHGATPNDAECQRDVEQFLPVLKELVHTPLFTDVRLAIRSEADAAPVLLQGRHRQSIDALEEESSEVALDVSDLNNSDLDLPSGHAAALLPEAAERPVIDLWPLGIAGPADTDTDMVTAGETQFFFFNALKNKEIDQLNYEVPLHRRDAASHDQFFEYLPLRAWKQEAAGPDLEAIAAPVEALTDAFKGRRAERAQLRGFAAHGSGTLMVFGAPGIGKSALLAQVTKEIEAGVDADGRPLTDADGTEVDAPPVISYFIRRSEGSDDAVRFLQFICRRLDRRYELQGIGLGNDTATLYENFRARLQTVEEQTEGAPDRTVLLVDGIDEGPELGRYVPAARPWLPVIVASRATPEAQTFYENRPATGRSQMTVGPMGPSEVRAMLYDGVNKYDPAFTETYVEAVAERSEGNPLYLTLLTEALFQGELGVGDIDALPTEMATLYRSAVQRVTDGGTNEDVVVLLHLLAEAKSSLPPAAIGELLGINPMRADAAVRAAMELLHEVPPETLYPTESSADTASSGGAVAAVQLFHESLREWLRSQHAGACAQMRTRLAEQTAEWNAIQDEATRRYALRYSAAHQRAAERPDALWTLLRETAYRDAQIKTFKQYDATYDAMQHGLDVYANRDDQHPDSDVRLARLALTAGDVADEAQTGVAQAFRWAEAGRMTDALQRIEVLEEEKYFLAILRLLWIEADRQRARPEAERSPETAEAVLEAFGDRIAPGTDTLDWREFVDDGFMAWWAERVLTACPELDLTGVLLRTSKSMVVINQGEGRLDIEEAVQALADRLPYCPDAAFLSLTRTAVRIIHAIENDQDRASALKVLATALSETDQFEKASDVFNEILIATQAIERNQDRASTLKVFATALAEAGADEQARAMFNEALIATQAIEHDMKRTSAFSELAKALADSGEKEQADAVFKTARKATDVIEDDRIRALALGTLAEALAEAGQFEAAQRKAEIIEDDSSRARALASLASALAESGQFEKTRSIAYTIEDKRWNASVLTDLATKLAESGSSKQSRAVFEEAHTTAQMIESNRGRAEVLTNLATKLAESGTKEQSRSVFEGARTATLAIENGRSRARALTDLAIAFAETGQFKESHTTAYEIENDRDRTEAMNEIATVLAEAGADEQARAVFEDIRTAAGTLEENSSRVQALTDLAVALTKASQFKEAHTTAQMIESNRDLAEVLKDLGIALAKAGADEQASAVFEEARNALVLMEDTWDLERTLVAFATALTEASQFERAHMTIQMLQNNRNRTRALTSLTTALLDSDNGERSHAIFEETLAAVQTTEHNNEHAQELTGLATALVETGQLEKGHVTAQMIEDDWDYAQTLAYFTTILAWREEFGKARTTAQMIESDYHRAWALTRLATALAEAGGEEQSHAVFEEAHTAAEMVEGDTSQTRALTHLVIALADTNQFKEACNVALVISDDWGRVRALNKITSEPTDIDQFKEVLAATQAIKDNRHRVRSLISLATALAKAGYEDQSRAVFEEAHTTTQAIEDESTRAQALTSLATALVEAGGEEQANAVFESAKEIADTIEHDYDRAPALRELASALAEAGQFEAAQEIADTIEYDSHRAPALRELASALAEAGQFEAAQKIVDTIEHDDDRARALRRLSGALAEADQFETAQKIANTIENAWGRAGALEELATALMEANNLEKAIKVALSIADLSQRAKAIEGIIKQYLRSGSPEELAAYLPNLDLSHEGWISVLSTWRNKILEHADAPLPLLRKSFTLYPFDREAATKGVYALVQENVLARDMETVAAIAAACPELGLDALAPEPGLPLPEGCDPETLPDMFGQQLDAQAAAYNDGDIDAATFKAKAEMIFEMAAM